MENFCFIMAALGKLLNKFFKKDFARSFAEKKHYNGSQNLFCSPFEQECLLYSIRHW